MNIPSWFYSIQVLLMFIELAAWITMMTQYIFWLFMGQTDDLTTAENAFACTVMLSMLLGSFPSICMRADLNVQAYHYVLKGIPYLGLLIWSIIFWLNLKAKNEETHLIQDGISSLKVSMSCVWFATSFWGGPTLIWAVVAMILQCKDNCEINRIKRKTELRKATTSQEEKMLQDHEN